MMGFVERQIRKSGNQKLAAPRFLDTSLSAAEVTAAVRSVVDAFNEKSRAEHADQLINGNRVTRWAASKTEAPLMYVTEDADECVVTYKYSVDDILKRPKAARSGGFWCATVVSVERGDGQRSAVKLTLTNWVINQDGKLQHREEFEWFTARMPERL